MLVSAMSCAFAPALPAASVRTPYSAPLRVVKCSAANDDLADVKHRDSWASVRGVAGQPIFSRPSLVSSGTWVEVHQYPAGWRSLVFMSVFECRVAIQSIVKIDAETGMADPMAIPNDYLKTMVAVALSARANKPVKRVLVLGMGAGSLPSLLGHCCPEAVTIDAVELDSRVAEAACGPLGLDTRRVDVHVHDAMAWLSQRAQDSLAMRYDLIFVDIFDGSNRTPEGFYSDAFMRDLRACLAPRGLVMHNLHSGTADLDNRLDDACQAYSSAFPEAACRVPALRPGNTIVATAAFEGAFDSLDAMKASAQHARQERRGLQFDASARLEGLRVIAQGSRSGATRDSSHSV